MSVGEENASLRKTIDVRRQRLRIPSRQPIQSLRSSIAMKRMLGFVALCALAVRTTASTAETTNSSDFIERGVARCLILACVSVARSHSVRQRHVTTDTTRGIRREVLDAFTNSSWLKTEKEHGFSLFLD